MCDAQTRCDCFRRGWAAVQSIVVKAQAEAASLRANLDVVVADKRQAEAALSILRDAARPPKGAAATTDEVRAHIENMHTLVADGKAYRDRAEKAEAERRAAVEEKHTALAHAEKAEARVKTFEGLLRDGVLVMRTWLGEPNKVRDDAYRAGCEDTLRALRRWAGLDKQEPSRAYHGACSKCGRLFWTSDGAVAMNPVCDKCDAVRRAADVCKEPPKPATMICSKCKTAFPSYGVIDTNADGTHCGCGGRLLVTGHVPPPPGKPEPAKPAGPRIWRCDGCGMMLRDGVDSTSCLHEIQCGGQFVPGRFTTEEANPPNRPPVPCE